MQTLYPEIKPYARHELAVDAPHVLYAVSYTHLTLPTIYSV